MKSSPSALLLVVGLLGALGAAYLLSWRLAPARPAPRFAGGAVQGPEQAGAAGGAGDSGAKAGAAPTAKPRKPGAYEVIEVKDGGTIRVLVDVPPEQQVAGSWVRVRVKDNGIGIPASELPKIFEPFSDVHSAKHHTSTGPNSAGLGLYIARGLVDLHGGLITVDSVEAEYTEFTVLLPRTEP